MWPFKWLRDYWDKLVDIVQVWYYIIKDVVEQWVRRLADFVRTVLPKFWWFSGVGLVKLKGWIDNANAWINWMIDAGWQAIWDAITNLGKKISRTFREWWPTIYGWVVDAREWINWFTNQGWPAIWDAITALGKKIQRSFREWFPTIYGWIVDLRAKIARTFRDWFPTIYGWIVDARKWINEFAENLRPFIAWLYSFKRFLTWLMQPSTRKAFIYFIEYPDEWLSLFLRDYIIEYLLDWGEEVGKRLWEEIDL